MNEISDGAIMAALGRQLNVAVAKQVVAAGNLANLDTPGYRTRDVAFDDHLERELAKVGMTKVPMTTTSALHTPGETSDSRQVTEAGGLASRRDGNNVQMDRELLTMTRASGDFAAAQTVLAAKFRLIRYSINEGR
jgi:flagellar basal-body rod protein FlgB